MALYLNYALTLFCFSAINAGRVLCSLYALHLGAQPSSVGILFASFFVFPLVLSWPIGVLSDRFGPRWLLLFGTLSGAAGILIPYFVPTLPIMYVAGLMNGLAFSFYKVLLENMVGLLSKPHERARNFANSSMVGASTHFVGPMIAGVTIDLFGHNIACLYVAALSLTAAVLVVLWGGLFPGGTRHAAAAGSVRESLSDPAILRTLLASGFVQMGQDFFQLYTPIYGHSIGLSASAIGSVLAAFALASFTVRFSLPQLITRLGEERLLAYALYVSAAGLMLMPFTHNVITLGLVCFVFGFGIGCGQPIIVMMLFSQSAAGRSGETFGLRQTTNNVLRVTAPTLFGFIATAFGVLPVFGINALMLVAGGALSRRNSTRRDGAPR